MIGVQAHGFSCQGHAPVPFADGHHEDANVTDKGRIIGVDGKRPFGMSEEQIIFPAQEMADGEHVMGEMAHLIQIDGALRCLQSTFQRIRAVD